MPKTSTERSREYRERERANELPKQSCKSGAQRAREFGERQKALKNAANARVPLRISETPTVHILQSKLKSSTSILIKMPKTSTERSREYRERKRANELPKQSCKSGAQRAREFRERQRALKNEANARVLLRISETPTVHILQSIPKLSTSSNASTIAMHCSSNTTCPYTNFRTIQRAYEEFNKEILNNPFEFACGICDRLGFEDDLKKISETHQQLLRREFPEGDVNNLMACKCCIQALNRYHVPTLSTFKGLKYPEKPLQLPELDLVSVRLISPRIPFMQIRRLRHVHGQCRIFGQVINVPVDVDTMTRKLLRDVDDDYCINVHIKKKKIHKSSYFIGLVNKRNIKSWLQLLCDSPLYKFHKITVNQSFFNDTSEIIIDRNEMSEDVPIEVLQPTNRCCYGTMISNSGLHQVK